MKGSIQKRHKTYYVVFNVINPDTGKRQQKWVSAGHSRREAEGKYIELLGEVHDGTYRDLKKATFKEFAETWLETYAKMTCKASTYRSFEGTVMKQLVPRFGSFMITDITTVKLQDFVKDRCKNRKPKTVINDIVVIKLMFKHAVKWGYLKRNPADDLERPKNDHESDEMQILTPEQVQRLLANINPKYRTLILTAVLTGLRRGELLGLQWGDLDGRHNQIHVKRAFCNVSKQFTAPKTKNAKRRVDMSPTLVRELKAHLEASGTRDATALVFSGVDGKPIDPDNFYRREFKPALERAKLPDVNFHSLRHTNVSLRIKQGQSIKYIQKQIGHAKAVITLDTYSHLFDEVNPEQAQKLDDSLGFVEKSDSLSEPEYGRLWKVSPETNEKRASDNMQPLEKIGSTERV